MALYEQYRDDLLNRPPADSFLETTVGSMILVELRDAGLTVIGAAQKLTQLDAYRQIREDLIGLRSEVAITVSEAQRDAWAGTPLIGEGFIYNTDGGVEVWDGVAWTPV